MQGPQITWTNTKSATCAHDVTELVTFLTQINRWTTLQTAQHRSFWILWIYATIRIEFEK